MSTLAEWLADAAEALGLPEVVDQDLLLDLARDVAHAVARPAAPLTTYLLGVAVGRGADPMAAAGVLRDLAAERAPG
jgi:hypothetical protein